MFLRSTKRWKDGKQHHYWSLVENRRCKGGRIVQHTVLYLGEINDSHLPWVSTGHSIETAACAPNRNLLESVAKMLVEPRNPPNS